MKDYSVNFYSIGLSKDDSGKPDIMEMLEKWNAGSKSGPVTDSSGTPYKIKDLVVHQGVARGVFAKYRHEDLPRIGSEKSNDERDIDIDDEEGLIEKNHFIYYPKKRLIAYQASREGSHSKQMERYFTECSGRTFSFNPVLRKDSWNRLAKTGVRPKKIEVSVASPKASLLNGLKFNRDLKRMMDESGSYNFHGTYSMGRQKSEYLNMDVEAVFKELMAQATVNVARVTVEDNDGDTHTIDLLLERIKGKISVNDGGRYPDSDEVFKAMNTLKQEFDTELNKVLPDA